ncbi:hypothetical protein EXIGLDRAFT_846226 [Exidia glandulosa HHB12029]|uniref:BTB domain-containing protein n=1 Tax=Exidia glandulosa HHB12029 TaxID=1314781 RepID=A0A165Z6A4_EXIGL|nr:hypothetical protein EXIGLDRAFT_846226 [Exidia glandulosa HHB12029]
MPDRYTIILRGKSFVLYRDQIDVDSPNYFTELFLGDAREAQTQSVELSRSPELFRFIVDYMSGYAVLPLNQAMLPPTMTPDLARANLLRDAEIYKLRGLVKLLRAADVQAETPAVPRMSLSTICDAFVLAEPVVDFMDVLNNKLPSGVAFSDKGIGKGDGKDWRPVPVRIPQINLSVEWRSTSTAEIMMLLTKPALSSTALAHARLKNKLSARRTVDRVEYPGIPCSLVPCAHVSLDGTDMTGQEFAEALHRVGNLAELKSTATAQSRPVDEVLLKIYREEERKLVVLAQPMVFTVKEAPGWDSEKYVGRTPNI